MFIIRNNLIFPSCPTCGESTEMYILEIYDSNPASYVWGCDCGYEVGYSVSFPMNEEEYMDFIRMNIRMSV